MVMVPSSITMPLSALIANIQSNRIRINPDYQRSGEIWPSHEKSFLVETVLLNMPIPRVLLHVLRPPGSVHESDIIDGQQRCTILREFRGGGFALSSAVDHKIFEGRGYDQLTQRQRDTFDSYLVPVDLYAGISSR